MTGASLPQEAYAAALSSLPAIGPATLAALLRRDAPDEMWRRVLDGQVVRPSASSRAGAAGRRTSWAEAAGRIDVGRRWEAIRSTGIHVTFLGGPHFPDDLVEDPEPPGVLFWVGDLDILARPRVGIVGTRQCTNYGRLVAAELGRDLAQCGVCVVSGLALGIDGAAHLGALSAAKGAGPLGVAASGVDVPYPRSHGQLWRRVSASGAIISETPPGQPAQAWRFPARNRLIAGLSHAVVVVESHVSGGSMLTVAAAAARGIEVLAVPGPVNSPSSRGTNQLLYEGLGPARHAGDVLAALGDLRPWPPKVSEGTWPHPSGRQHAAPTEASRPHAVTQPGSVLAPPSRPVPTLEGADMRVLSSVDRTPTPTSAIADRTGLHIGQLSVVLLRLEGLGLVRGEGTWWERCGDQ